jgi:hypothetical protein
MNNEEQRIAIAGACSWELSENEARSPDGSKWGMGTGMFAVLPNYPDDLNAMHEAEKVLQESSWDDYVAYLYGANPDEKNLIHATASMKAEAFLRTLNLWKE